MTKHDKDRRSIKSRRIGRTTNRGHRSGDDSTGGPSSVATLGVTIIHASGIALALWMGAASVAIAIGAPTNDRASDHDGQAALTSPAVECPVKRFGSSCVQLMRDALNRSRSFTIDDLRVFVPPYGAIIARKLKVESQPNPSNDQATNETISPHASLVQRTRFGARTDSSTPRLHVDQALDETISPHASLVQRTRFDARTVSPKPISQRDRNDQAYALQVDRWATTSTSSATIPFNGVDPTASPAANDSDLPAKPAVDDLDPPAKPAVDDLDPPAKPTANDSDLPAKPAGRRLACIDSSIRAAYNAIAQSGCQTARAVTTRARVAWAAARDIVARRGLPLWPPTQADKSP